MSNMSGDGGSLSSGNTGEAEVQQQQQQQQQHILLINGTSASTNTNSNNSSASQQPPATPPPPVKKKRNLPGTPDPTAEVIALSPTTLMATNRFVCEICNKGFQRDQNLQLHRRGHNLPWKLRQRTSTEIRKRVYICPEVTCVHHNPSRALGDLTGIKKHFCRKHGEKKWKCDKCSKKYAVQSDWKAHSKTCGTREYKCDCGTIFSRRDSFITHRAFCDALTEENNKGSHGSVVASMPEKNHSSMTAAMPDFFPELKNPLKPLQRDLMAMPLKPLSMAGAAMFSSNSGALFGSVHSAVPSASASASLQLGGSHGSAHMSATQLLQKAAQMGATASGSMNSPMLQRGMVAGMAGHDMRALGGFEQTPEQFFNPTGDLAGFAGVFESGGGGGGGVKMVQREWEMMTVDFMGVDRGRSVHEHHQQQQRLQGLHPFQHPLMRHGQQAMEKSMEDV
ncbi:hypothetical protein J5N97_008936 [Dioscorea zingiberensis]|uniref:Protein EARLY HEADING DATE 2 n=1 Tax=Dioscorea zingiberensis TaxID=325984 RepID=A0A9D5CW58_9LILI|nr:hypothetical protein J5N97_008936 [Dioscorea zingiberensis]